MSTITQAKTVPQWEHSDKWTTRADGNGYRIEVSHFTRGQGYGGLGPHHWCVYAYIFPSHPLFAQFTGNNLWQPATEEIPLHGGCTFLQAHRNEKGEPVSWQVGCDYSHLYDDHFSHLPPEFASESEVFRDALALANALAAMKERAPAESTRRNGEG